MISIKPQLILLTQQTFQLKMETGMKIKIRAKHNNEVYLSLKDNLLTSKKYTIKNFNKNKVLMYYQYDETRSNKTDIFDESIYEVQKHNDINLISIPAGFIEKNKLGNGDEINISFDDYGFTIFKNLESLF